MDFISRSFLNKLINEQFNTKKERNKKVIYREFKIKPYKREGKTLLYNIQEINRAGINYVRDLKGYYPIPNFEEKFWINKQSTIINVYNEEIVKSYIGTDLYEHVRLRFYGRNYRKRVHSLMGKTFLGNPPVVNHQDGNKSNNNLSNLEKSTHQKNIQHAYDNNYYSSRGGKGTKVSVKDKITGNEFSFPSLRQCEKFTEVDRHRIKNIANHKIANNTNWEFLIK